jgi:hypothetical protein
MSRRNVLEYLVSERSGRFNPLFSVLQHRVSDGRSLHATCPFLINVMIIVIVSRFVSERAEVAMRAELAPSFAKNQGEARRWLSVNTASQN